MSLDPVGKYVKIQLHEAPAMTQGGIHIPADATRKTLFGTVLVDFDQTVDGFHYQFSAGSKVFWAFGPVGAKYMNEDGKELVFMPPGEIYAREVK